MNRINSDDGQFHDGDPSLGTKGTKVTADWLNALQDAVIGMAGSVANVAAATALTESHGIIFVNTAAGNVTIHLPTYGNCPAAKIFTIKNIGDNQVLIDCTDGKTIDGAGQVVLPTRGDIVRIVKDGANWQTI